MPPRYLRHLMAASLLLGLLPGVAASAQTGDSSKHMALLGKSQVTSRHPDLFYREAAIRNYQAGGKELAFRLFLRAAGYADKPSQAIIATMYWQGDGVPQNRPLGYAWMDLAAMRGYSDLLVQRERYWAELSEDERTQAVEQGREIYAQYSDEQGLKRLDRALRRELSKATGSRTGFGGTNLTVLLREGAGAALAKPSDPTPAVLGGTPVPGTDDYAPALWSAKLYSQLQDEIWKLPAAAGSVDVGPLQKVEPAPAAAPADEKP